MTFSKKSEENISPTQSWSRNGLLARTPPSSLPADSVPGWRGRALGPRGAQVTGAGRGQWKVGERLLCTGACARKHTPVCPGKATFLQSFSQLALEIKHHSGN